MTWFENLFLAQGIGWAAALGDVAVRSTVLLAVAGLVALLLRKRPATVRHRVWTLALAGVLGLPVVGLIVPELPLSVPMPDLRVSLTQRTSPPPSVDDGSGGLARSGAQWPANAQRPLVARRQGRDGFTTEEAGSNPASRATSAFRTTAPGTEDVAPLDAWALTSLEDRETSVSAFWPQWVLSVWAIGAGVPLGRLLVGRFMRRRLGRAARPVTDPERLGMFDQIAAELEIRRPVQLLESDDISVPVTWGCWQAVVAVPATAETWSEDKWRVVLLHELTHVRRGDCLSQLVSQLTCVVHWFNPLAWFGATSLRLEGERACDEEVIRAGTRASDYAEHLLEIAQACQPRDWTASATVGMARRSQLEGRLLDILEPVRSQAPSTGLRYAASAVVGATILAVAAVQPAAMTVPGQSPQPNTQLSLSAVPVPATAYDAAVAEILGQRSNRDPVDDPAARLDTLVRPVPPQQAPGGVSAAVERGLEAAQAALERAQDQWRVSLDGRDWSDFNGNWAQGFDFDFDWDSAFDVDWNSAFDFDFDFDFGGQDLSWGVGQRNARPLDDRVVSAFIDALDDSQADVRRSAAAALGRSRVDRAVGPLAEALSDSDAGVREAAARALGRIRSADAVPRLVGALSDAEPRVAARAAVALGQIRSEAAVSGLSGALDHEDGDVREHIVRALGRIKSPAAVDGLVTALGDASPAIRARAAAALGAIRNETAVSGLSAAYPDEDPDVRERIVRALGAIRSPTAVGTLSRALDDEETDVRMAAARALGSVRDASAVDGLIGALDDADQRVVRYAIRALARINDARAIDALADAVGHDNPDVRRAAIIALSGSGSWAAHCWDGVDNDGDGQVDGGDRDCR